MIGILRDLRIRPVFAWHDLWIGARWDRRRRRLYLLPAPCIGVCLDFGPPLTNRWTTEKNRWNS